MAKSDYILIPLKWILFNLCARKIDRYFKLRALLWTGLARLTKYEKKHLDFLSSYLRTGDNAIDVGAHYGIYAMHMARLVGTTGKVLAFEPLVDLFRVLEARSKNFPNILCINSALSDRSDAELNISIPLLCGCVPEPAWATLQNYSGKHLQQKVCVATLDSFMNQLHNLRFIKVDVEGAELAFLRGAKQVIKSFRPLIQFEENAMRQNLALYQDFCQQQNYELLLLGEGNKLKCPQEQDHAKENNYYLSPKQ